MDKIDNPILQFLKEKQRDETILTEDYWRTYTIVHEGMLRRQ